MATSARRSGGVCDTAAAQHDGAVPAVAGDQPVELELAVGAADGVDGHAEVVGEVPDGREASVGQEHAAADHRADLVAELGVRRHRAVGVEADDHRWATEHRVGSRRTRQWR